MNAQIIRDYANHGIEANRVLLESAEDLANLNQVAQSNRNVSEIQSQQREILNRFDQMFNHFNQFEQRLDRIEQRFDRFEQRFDRFETRLDEISVVSARVVNANCVKPSFQIQWVKVSSFFFLNLF